MGRWSTVIVSVACLVPGVTIHHRLGELDQRLGVIEARLSERIAPGPPQVPLPFPVNDSTSAAIVRMARSMDRIEQRLVTSPSAASSSGAGRADDRQAPAVTEPSPAQEDALNQATERVGSILASGTLTPEQLREVRQLSAQTAPSQSDAVFELHRRISAAINAGQLKMAPPVPRGGPSP